MALTKDLLVANEGLASLSEEQINTIVTLSANDENSVIGERTGKIYGDLDSDILASTGVEKNQGERTFDYMKRVLTEYKETANQIPGLNTQIASLAKDKARLEKTISEGSLDAEAKKQLKQAEADRDSIKKQYNDLVAQHQASEEQHKADLFNYRLDNELERAKGGLKFKKEFTEDVQKVLLSNAMHNLKSLNPHFEDDGNGNERLVFVKQDGATMLNEKNMMKPYTAGELLMKELDAMQVLDHARNVQGGGSRVDSQPGSHSTFQVDLGGAKTQREARQIIHDHLMAQGLSYASSEYQNQMDAAWRDNKISALPFQ